MEGLLQFLYTQLGGEQKAKDAYYRQVLRDLAGEGKTLGEMLAQLSSECPEACDWLKGLPYAEVFAARPAPAAPAPSPTARKPRSHPRKGRPTKAAAPPVVSRKRTNSQAVRDLAGQIKSTLLSQGTALGKVKLAELLGKPADDVRSALQRLIREGAVETQGPRSSAVYVLTGSAAVPPPSE